MATDDEIQAFDAYERIRPIMEEYFDNWLICGRKAGTKQRYALGHTSDSWQDMQGVRNEINRWQEESMENPGEVPPGSGEAVG